MPLKTTIWEGKHIHGGEQELMRSTEQEKNQQVSNVQEFREFHWAEARAQLTKLQKLTWELGNSFAVLMEAAKCCSRGSMSHALYEVGGEYRRNM